MALAGPGKPGAVLVAVLVAVRWPRSRRWMRPWPSSWPSAMAPQWPAGPDRNPPGPAAGGGRACRYGDDPWTTCRVPEDWERGVAVVAHPDDMEYGASSAIARWTDQGKDVRYVMVTRVRPASGASPGRGGPAAQRGAAAQRRRGRRVPRRVPRPPRRHGAARPAPALRPGQRHPPPPARGGRGVELPGDLGRHGVEPPRSPGRRHRAHRRGPRRRQRVGVPRARRGGASAVGGPAVHRLRRESTAPTHGVDVTAQLDRGVASLLERKVYLEALGQEDPTGFLAAFAPPRPAPGSAWSWPCCSSWWTPSESPGAAPARSLRSLPIAARLPPVARSARTSGNSSRTS